MLNANIVLLNFKHNSFYQQFNSIYNLMTKVKKEFFMKQIEVIENSFKLPKCFIPISASVSSHT